MVLIYYVNVNRRNKKMTQYEKHALMTAISEKFNGYHSLVRIYEKGMSWDGERIEFVVNWAATGDNTPEETLKMAHFLKMAARVCESLNKKGYVFEYKEGEDDELTLDAKRAMLDEYRDLIEELYCEAWWA